METEIKETQNVQEEMRNKRRENLKHQQEFKRSNASASNRLLEAEILTEKDVAGLCSRIKRKKHAGPEDLGKLGNAFIQSEANIAAFIKTTGAINILIKELTGGDRSQQILAAQCLCNLSLGDEVCCSKIASFAGSYLMIFLMNSSENSLAVSLIFSAPPLGVSSNFIPARLLVGYAKHRRRWQEADEHSDVAGAAQELPSHPEQLGGARTRGAAAVGHHCGQQVEGAGAG